jgi:hypothetical protein
MQSFAEAHPHRGEDDIVDAEADTLIKAYREAQAEFLAADHALGQFLTGDDPLS